MYCSVFVMEYLLGSLPAMAYMVLTLELFIRLLLKHSQCYRITVGSDEDDLTMYHAFYKPVCVVVVQVRGCLNLHYFHCCQNFYSHHERISQDLCSATSLLLCTCELA